MNRKSYKTPPKFPVIIWLTMFGCIALLPAFPSPSAYLRKLTSDFVSGKHWKHGFPTVINRIKYIILWPTTENKIAVGYLACKITTEAKKIIINLHIPQTDTQRRQKLRPWSLSPYSIKSIMVPCMGKPHSVFWVKNSWKA